MNECRKFIPTLELLQESPIVSLSNFRYWKKLLDFQEPPLFGYKSTPETPAVLFSPLTAHSANPKTGGPARRTRSRQHNTAKTTLFQSPMIY